MIKRSLPLPLSLVPLLPLLLLTLLLLLLLPPPESSADNALGCSSGVDVRGRQDDVEDEEEDDEDGEAFGSCPCWCRGGGGRPDVVVRRGAGLLL
jgi:hypothetical protein